MAARGEVLAADLGKRRRPCAGWSKRRSRVTRCSRPRCRTVSSRGPDGTTVAEAAGGPVVLCGQDVTAFEVGLVATLLLNRTPYPLSAFARLMRQWCETPGEHAGSTGGPTASPTNPLGDDFLVVPRDFSGAPRPLR